jgi:hypothetical protein
VVLRALEKQPERRYQEASEVKNDVETIARMADLQSLLPPTGQRFAPIRRRVIKYATPAVLLALCLMAILVFSWRRDHTNVPLSLAPKLRISGTWEQLAPASMLKGRAGNTAIWTGKEVLVFGGEGFQVTFGDGARYDLDKRIWAPLPLEGAAPSARTCSSSVWTDHEMIIWGGFSGSYSNNVNRNDGACFNPTNNAWRPISIENAPSPRFAHSAVWTGKEMLVWGGYTDSHNIYKGGRTDAHLDTGGRYDPAADSWHPITTNAAPSKRYYHGALWTGREMVIWGGANATDALNDGARYDPVTDIWRPISTNGAPCPRLLPLAVWTGSEIIVWGGCSREADARATHFNDGARYNPQTDTWTPLSTQNTPQGRYCASVAWSGTEMLVWGGVDDAHASSYDDPRRYLGTGARYNPATDVWAPIPTNGAPSPRLVTSVWAGAGLFIFGGYNGEHLNDTYCFWLNQ